MYKIGFAQEVITPPVGVGLAGYMNKRPNVGVLSLENVNMVSNNSFI